MINHACKHRGPQQVLRVPPRILDDSRHRYHPEVSRTLLPGGMQNTQLSHFWHVGWRAAGFQTHLDVEAFAALARAPGRRAGDDSKSIQDMDLIQPAQSERAERIPLTITTRLGSKYMTH